MAWADVYVQKATLSPTTAATSHTVTPSTAFTAGNFAVLIVSSASAVTTPTGWTRPVTPPSSDIRPTIFYRTVPVGGLSSQSFTIATSGMPRAVMYEFTSAVSFEAAAVWSNSTWNTDPGQSGQAVATYSGDIIALGVLVAGNNADHKYDEALWDGPNYTLSSNRFVSDTALKTAVGFDPELYVARLFATGAATYGTRASGPEGPGTMYRPQGSIIVMEVAAGSSAAAAAGTITITGAGVAQASAAGAGSVIVTGAAVGGAAVAGAGSLVVTGAATARGAAQAAGSVTMVGAATATGQAAAAGVVTLTGAAVATAAATATGTLTLAGAASATSAGSATAAGGLVLTGAAQASAAATAAGTLTLAGAAVASSAGSATAAGGLVLTGSATASAQAVAAGAIVLAGAATASGGAVAAGSLALAGAAQASSAGSAQASGTLVLTGAASATGQAVALGGLLLVGAALARAAAAASGGLTLVGAAAASGPPPDTTPADLTIHTGAASYTRIIPGPTARRTIHPGRTL